MSLTGNNHTKDAVHTSDEEVFYHETIQIYDRRGLRTRAYRMR